MTEALAATNAGAGSAWPRAAQERRDFFHRIREFPPQVADWRKTLVDFARSDRQRFPGIDPSAPIDVVRGHVDDGASMLREVNDILAAVHGRLPSSRAKPSLWGAEGCRRLLGRLGIYPGLGVAARELEKSDLLGEPGLIPPNLVLSLACLLSEHARLVCTKRDERCGDCDIRGFCRAYRDRFASEAESSDAPITVDMFCGAGGLTEGFSRAGFRSVMAIDNDAMALRTFRFNHPGVRDSNIIVGDVRSLSADRILAALRGRRLDVLLGAPPCQGYSMVGNRSKGAKRSTKNTIHSDERNYLFESFIRLAVALKPRLLIMENVPGMETARVQGQSFAEMAASMLKDGGFTTAAWKLDASAFGVPQERTRLFLVGSTTKTIPARPCGEYQTLAHDDFDPDALPPVTLDDAIFDLPPLEAGTGEPVSRWVEKPVDTRRERRYIGKFHLATSPRVVFNHTVRYHNDRDLELYSLLSPGEDSVHILERGRRDLMRYRSEVFDDKYLRLRGDRPCKTIVSHLAKDGNGYIHPTQIRSLSFREAARVQSFHDAYVFCGSPSDQWVQLGNAVPPVLGEAIGRSFMTYLARNR